jgi:hypothetical protein
VCSCLIQRKAVSWLNRTWIHSGFSFSERKFGREIHLETTNMFHTGKSQRRGGSTSKPGKVLPAQLPPCAWHGYISVQLSDFVKPNLNRGASLPQNRTIRCNRVEFRVTLTPSPSCYIKKLFVSSRRHVSSLSQPRVRTGVSWCVWRENSVGLYLGVASCQCGLAVNLS